MTLELAIPLLEEAAGGRVDGLIGDNDPFVAVREAVTNVGVDEILISTLPGLAFGAVTFLTLCAPTLREIYGRRLASTAAPSAIARLRPQVGGVDAAN